MTPDERQMLIDLAAKIAQTPPPPRDPEAEDLIRTRIGSRPDALYLMTQTVLIQNMALDHAKQEIEQLKQGRPAAPVAGGGFLGGTSPQYPPQQYAPAPQYVPQRQGGGLGGFLQSAATTAAGVAAGALAFEGIRSMFGGGLFGGHSHQESSGLLGGTQSEAGGSQYYDPPAEGGAEEEVEAAGDDDSAAEDSSADDGSSDDSQ